MKGTLEDKIKFVGRFKTNIDKYLNEIVGSDYSLNAKVIIDG